MKLVRLIFFGWMITMIASCNNTKHLAAGQNLFIGSSSKVKTTAKISKSQRKDLEEQMQSLVRPKPNSNILGIRFKLSVYNSVKEPKKKKGLKYWLKYKVGEPPVIASNTALEKNRQIIQNHLDNKGYFRDSVVIDTSIKNKKLKVTYTALLDSQYKIRQTSYPNDSTELAKQIQSTAINKKEILLKPNDPYDLDVIKNERTRIDANLKEHGYYYFGPDYLIADVDSTIGYHKVNIDMRVKPETPFIARQPYYIKDVYVFTSYSMNSDTSLIGAKKYQGYTIIDPHNRFKPQVFSRTLVFKPGDVYNRTDHNLSLNRLISLGVYKFVKVRFEQGDSAQTLNAFYYLTPTNKKSIRFEVSALQRSNNTTGTEFTINWRNRNLFRGAELLTISANAGFEKQISSGINTNILTAGLEADLYLPRILAPFKLNTSSAFVPQTKFSAGYQFYNSTAEYLLTSLSGTYGYVWKNAITNEHQLTLFNINYVKPTNITEQFQQSIDTNLTLKRSIEQQFILGTIYNYNYSSLAKVNINTNNFYFNGNVDVSGNLLALLTGANSYKQGKQVNILGTPFSQYIRLEADFRHYLRLGNAFRSFNSRIDAGVGYAYGNSYSMPFVKEFFAGGVSDMRGFRARTLGPGTFYGNSPKDSIIIEQPGDVKLLGQFEYRAKLFSIVRYALFTDIGNIWTLRDTTRPGSKFTSHFLSQLAADAGVGLRLDISILVLRLDMAFPVRVPYTLPGGEAYKVNLGSSQWRKDNLIFNLAIGYPF